MHRIAAPAALLAVLAACVPAGATLSAADRAEIRRHVPGADLSALTPAQARALEQELHHGDGFDAAYHIRSILMW